MKRSRKLTGRELGFRLGPFFRGAAWLVAVSAVVGSACGPAGLAPAASRSGLAFESEPTYPQPSWQAVEVPEEVGWSSEGLTRVRDRLSGMSTSAFMAVVGGRVLMDYEDIELVSYLASVRKSVLSILYGIHIERGDIVLERTLAEIGIDDHGGLTDDEKRATVAHLLAARSGVYRDASNAGDDLASAPPRGSQAPGRTTCTATGISTRWARSSSQKQA